MKIIVINPILFTHEKGIIPHVTTIKETMIYDLCLAYHRAGHAVTLIAAADYAPERKETYDFEVVFLKSIGRKIFQPSVLPFLPGEKVMSIWFWRVRLFLYRRCSLRSLFLVKL